MQIHPYIYLRIFISRSSYFVSVAEHFAFNGSSILKWDLKEFPIVSTSDSINFRMKTNVANGVLLYSRGTQGDYFALQLRENRLVLNVNLGRR